MPPRPRLFRSAVAGCLAAALLSGVRSSLAQAGATSALSARPYVGNWDCAGHGGAYPSLNLNADGSWSDGGGHLGAWFLDRNQLVVHYTAHPEWEDSFDLPGHNGVLSGRDAGGGVLTLTRRSGLPPAATPAPASAGSYFGTLRPGAATAAAGTPPVRRPNPAESTVVIPPPAPAAPLVSSGTRTLAIVQAVPTPVSTPPAAVVNTPPTEAPAAPLTPVGKWHWHAGPDRTFNGNGSVLDGTKVIGQWKWTNKDKGELQVNWSGTHSRAEAYTLSPHGHHLTHLDDSGHAFTDDRLD